MTFDKAVHLAANDDLPYLRKRLRRDYAQFLIDFFELQDDPIQQKILESARAFRNQHDMNQTDSIRQAVKLRKDLLMDLIIVWTNTVMRKWMKRMKRIEQRKNAAM